MSSIGKRVAEAMEKIDARDAEGALYQICSALGSTADREYPNPGGKSYRQFIHDNMSVITRVGMGVEILNLHLGGFSHPEITPDASGTCRFEQVLYHAVRCGLYHEGKLPDDLRFEFGKAFDHRGPVLVLPAELIYGLITAVVIAPVNAGEKLPDHFGFIINGCCRLRADAVWGKRAEFRWLLDAVPTPPPRPEEPEPTEPA
jgi:hypothetical protein